MNIKRYGFPLAVAAAASLLLTSCAANESSANNSGADSSLSGTLVGGGASSQQAAQEAWVAAFQTANPDVTVEYAPEGSGAGRENFMAGASSFAGSDAAFTTEEISSGEFASCTPDTGIIEIPAYISPIAIVFNIEGVDSLNLDAATLAGIFKGDINNWTDEAIVSQNPDADLPDQAITAVHRSDESGTTENFTDYLHAAAGDVWDAEAGETWPYQGGEGAQGTSGVIDAVTNGTGTIGYADASRAGDLGTVAIKVGDEYVPYSAEAAAAIVDASPFAEGRGEGDLAIELDRSSTESGVYPIVLVSYLIACNEYQDAEAAELTKAYLSYVISEEGQATSQEAAGTAPISSTLFEKASAAVEAIK
ncbi:phosphate ABC transporter substrate-binding protein PstS [Paramicrobacterium agarici]|uniref:phosphate ABC transporter substrate-binding protein PstS n=1 Tax=Paramicrobacterium agarici TaxID=630514 RepID=UPI001152760E|nr:phosphate ABC transporter substrate-binding protein PstS [Microbacterium agarici]TQO23838.1 phosphate ABC transporter substrate-binding protein (PhoT family) [Microbacterium agarici]